MNELFIFLFLFSFYEPQICNFIKNETPVHVFSCQFCKIFKNTYFVEHLRTAVSENRKTVSTLM